MTEADRLGGYTPLRAVRFYIPLLLQGFSQSLTYPLVAAIVTHGSFGVHGLTAFAQGQTVMFMIGALGGGLVMTGMVFARTRPGFEAFKRLNVIMMATLLSVESILCVHPFDVLIFQNLLKLSPVLANQARWTMFWGVFMQASFFLRNVPLVALFNARESGKANIATFARVMLTAAFSPLFIHFGWVGPMAGLVALTIPCLLEYALSEVFARPYIRALPAADPQPPSVGTQFAFTMPLSFGGFLLATAPFMIAAFVGHSANHETMLAIHYVTIGVVNPVGYAALRMQAVSIAFPPEYSADHRMFHFALGSGLLLSVLPLFFVLPSVSNWYFHTVQNVPLSDVWMARSAMGIYALTPILQTIRGHAEGLAAWMKRPNAILAGQATNLAALVSTLAITLTLGFAGWQMAVTAVLLATVGSILAVRLGLLLAKLEDRFGAPSRNDLDAH